MADISNGCGVGVAVWGTVSLDVDVEIGVRDGETVDGGTTVDVG